MSEVQARPSASRGRGSSRGGRGSYGSRGGARAGSRSATNGTKPETIPSSSVEDEGEVGELKKKYSDKLATIKELFPDWTDEDVVYALQETDGDLEGTIERITEGSVSQWGEVKKKTKDRSRSKVKDAASASTSDVSSLPTGRGAARGGRGGLEGGRAGRGRASERGRSHARGARAGSTVPTNGHRAKDTTDHTVDGAKTSIATDESSAWNATASKPGADSAHSTWDSTAAAAAAVVAADSNPTSERPSTSVIPGGTTKSWASMFAKPTPPPAPKKTAAPQAAPQTKADLKGANALPPPIPSDAKVDGDTTPIGTPLMNELDPTITPSKDELTETNVGQVPDTSIPPASATAASTVATSKDPRGGADGATPFSTATQQSSSRPPTSGYAATAFKATGTPGRTSSFQRRVLDQQEAVVMPGNDALDRTTAPLGSMGSVDRAAVQFGSLGLNGASDDLDVDEDREEAETRAQPPQHSPVAHPRASLPPAPTSSMPSHQPAPKDMEPTPRHAPGFPPAAPSQQPPAPQQASPQAPVGPQTMTQQTSQGSHQYGQFNRYAQPQQDQSSANQKPYDPFGHANQAQSQPNQYDGYPSQAQGQGQAQQQQASQLGAFSSAPNDYSSYYTSDQQRGAYQNYYGSQYGQQAGQTPQDAGSTQQRAGSGYGHNAADSSQYPSAPGQPGQNRYPPATEATASAHSGHSTPNPSATGQQASGAPSQQPQHPQGQAGGHNSYPYGHPYYSSPYYAAYMNQFGYGQGYNAPYGGKGGVYGQPHQSYGQSSYEHSSSPANLGGFGQPSQSGRDGGAGAGLGDYGRTGSAQPPQGQGHSSGGGAFGGMPDVFGRSGFQNQNVPLGQQAAHSQAGGDDSIKGYGDTKTTTGPSPLLNQPGRPGSATNAAPGQQGQSQAQNQQGFAGYPGHLNHHGHGGQGGQYGGLGGLGGGQSHQGSGYGQYGSGYGGSGYGYGSSGRGGGGWGGNYGH